MKITFRNVAFNDCISWIGHSEITTPLQLEYLTILLLEYVLPLSLRMKSYGGNIQMKPFQQYVRMVFSTWYVALTFEDFMLPC